MAILDMKWRAVLVAVLIVAGAAQGQDKAPSPSPAEQADAEKLIKDTFKGEYSKRGQPDRQALAKQLLAQGLQSKDDAKVQFVLFREARDLAAQAGDPETAIAAVSELSKRFSVDSPGMKSAALTLAAKSARTNEDFKTLVGTTLKVIDAALLADDFESAERFAGLALQHAKRAQDIPLTSRVSAKSREITESKARHEKLRKARETLVASPEDGAANLVVGQFLCLVKGDWGQGLPLLAKGVDPAFASLAQKDLANPVDVAGPMEVGDGWWDLSEKNGSPAKERLKERAGVWYANVAEKLTGLNQSKVDKRLVECRVAGLLRGTWLDVTDARLFSLQGKPGEPVEVASKQGQTTTVKLQFPKGEFDGVSAKIILDPFKNCTAFLIYEGPNSLAMLFDTERGFLSNARGTGNGWNLDYKDNWTKEAETFITVLLAEGQYVLYVNGLEKTRLKAPRALIEYVGLESRNATIKFDRIKLRRLE